ncbi:MAG: hypothetical protein L3J41_15965 [Melioribacteraceae bacterium]|nr:hypothetical protein [Melioribacteraceae bacterium]
MTTITIKNGEKLSRTHFKGWEDLQMELILMQEKIELSSEHIEILKSREKEADNATDMGLSWKKVKSGLNRKNV